MESESYNFIKKQIDMIFSKKRERHTNIDMTAMDFAYERGYISEDEWQSAQNKSMQIQKKEGDKLKQIARIRKKHPEEFKAFIKELLQRIKGLETEASDIIKAKKVKDHDLSFNIALLKDIRKTIDKWYRGEKTKNDPIWAWKRVFTTVKEVESKIYTYKNR